MTISVRHKIRAVVSLFTFSCFLMVCNAQIKISARANDPDMVIQLPGKVNEISSLCYSGGFVYAIDDEHGSVYKIELKKNPRVQKWKFGKDHDYEAVALANSKLYVLNSNGHIMQFEERFPVKAIKKYDMKLKGKTELESLYFDVSANKIVALCKECACDGKDKNSAWAFDVSANRFDKEPLYTVNRKDIEKIAGEKIGQFKPSAASINPVTHELYIVSSINKILVIIKDGAVKEVIKLDHSVYKQPEGICFSPEGDMYISNESAGEGPANILFFRRL